MFKSVLFILTVALFGQIHAEDSDGAKYITQADIKNMWLAKIVIPNKMDRDYHKKLREQKKMLEIINSGVMDKQAILAAAQYNQSIAITAGDEQRAKLYSIEIESSTRVIEAEAAELAKKNADEELESLKRAISNLEYENRMRREEIRRSEWNNLR